MNLKQLHKQQKDSHWHAERRKGIGGSDAAACCGFSPWKTPYQLWEEKRNIAPPDETNDAMRWGTKLEPLIRDEYEHVTGNEVFYSEDHITFVSDVWTFARVNVDGLIDNGSDPSTKVLECKSAIRTSGDWGEPGTDQIPDYYAIQGVHTMAVMPNIESVDFAVLLPYNNFAIYTLERDDDVIEKLMAIESDFWRRVIEDDPPPAISHDDCKRRFARSKPGMEIECDSALLNVVSSLKAQKQIKKQAEEQIDALSLKLKQRLGEADTIIDPATEKVLATWKETKPAARFEQKAFELDHPDLFEKYLGEPKTQRRLLIK